jgi:hypothetical protein
MLTVELPQAEQNFSFRLSSAVATELSAWIDEQPDPKPTIAEATVHVLEKWADWQHTQRG